MGCELNKQIYSTIPDLKFSTQTLRHNKALTLLAHFEVRKTVAGGHRQTMKHDLPSDIMHKCYTPKIGKQIL
jgi:hypothetical protein